MPIKNPEAVKAHIAKYPLKVRLAVAKANDKNADQMVAFAQRLAPRRTGALVASIRKRPGVTELAVEVTAGDAKAFYARFVEFGTRGSYYGEVFVSTEKKTFGGITKQARTRKAKRTHPGTRAQPFFFPAYRALKPSMKNRTRRAAKAALQD